MIILLFGAKNPHFDDLFWETTSKRWGALGLLKFFLLGPDRDSLYYYRFQVQVLLLNDIKRINDLFEPIYKTTQRNT